MLRFAEELLILLLDEGSGEPINIPDRALGCALAGAVLMDLALENRIDTDPNRLILVDPTPVDDDLLDPVLAEIASAADTRSAAFWVARIAGHGPDIRDRALTNLAQRGILDADDAGILSLSRQVARSRRYPLAERIPAMQEIRLRIMGILFSDDIPSPEDAAIIGLADACGIFDYILTAAERAQAEQRIKTVGRLDLIGNAVAQTIAQLPAAAPEITAAEPERRPWPRARGLPIIGNARSLMTGTMPFLLRQYREHGPVFEVRALNRRIVALAGADANRLMQRQGKTHFRSLELWRNFHAELGVAHNIISLDGAEHTRYRRAFRPAYSRERLESHIAVATDIARREIANWPVGQPIPVAPAMRRIAVEQMAIVTANTPALDYLDDLTAYVNFLLRARVLGRRPRFLRHLPRIRRARRRLRELYDKAMANRQPAAALPVAALPVAGDGAGVAAALPDRDPDIIDAILELHRADPQLLPETDLWLASMSPFITGIDTVPNTLSFILYALLKRPELQDAVRAEADALFAAGAPDADCLREMDVTRRVVMETMRMYPAVGMMFRTVANSFDFAGYRIPAGAGALLANALPHYLPEHFPNPERFDIDRYTPGRMEHSQPGAYAPFGLGPHTCLGNGFAIAQMMLTTAAIFHDADLSLSPPGYRLKTRYTPALAPERRFAFRLTRHRHR